ncbi:hypothetical protein [Armatimonas rosea]|uniref:Uncharacterized protein n=1 Tax=Armatimonas rosea TaxID=685828 RepID=A0A7W9W8A2_ARMRO|nr:hypothetical protein [Armatimonas rosea]MBB6053314.1 hypothetical protein [Armatimonas rosea]
MSNPIAFSLLLAYAQAQEAKRALDAIDFGYYDDLTTTEKCRLWWDQLDHLFPAVATTCPPVTVEDLIAHDELDTLRDTESIASLEALTPAELRDQRWRFECYDEWEAPDSEHVDYKLDHYLRQLRHQAMAAAGVSVSLPTYQEGN